MTGWLGSLAYTNVGPSAPALNRAVISSLAEGTNPTGPSLTGIYQES